MVLASFANIFVTLHAFKKLFFVSRLEVAKEAKSIINRFIIFNF
jgi:hypothetical protein